ncbi:MAG: DUF6090 family protein [Polaribacter sp.]
MKLFRKSRFSKLKQNKIASYLVYAIGEIFLVVLGILIAVYINNKNEERQKEKELKNIFYIIKNDLLNDIKEAKEIVLIEENKKELYHSFFSNKLTVEDYKENYQLRKLIFGYFEISFNRRGFNLLNEFKNIDKSKDSLIIKSIELYTHRIDEVIADDELRDIEFKETFNYWKSQDWWFDYLNNISNKDSFNSKEFIDYVLNSKDYRNRVSSWHFVNKFAFIPELERFIEEAEEIVEIIALRKK